MADNGGPGDEELIGDQQPQDDEGMALVQGDADTDDIDMDTIQPAHMPPPLPIHPQPIQPIHIPAANAAGPDDLPAAAGTPWPGPWGIDDDPMSVDPDHSVDVSDSEASDATADWPTAHCLDFCRPKWRRTRARSRHRKRLCQGLRKHREHYRNRWMERGRIVTRLQARITELEERLRGGHRRRTEPVSTMRVFECRFNAYNELDLAGTTS